jgi:DNA repair photolyase
VRKLFEPGASSIASRISTLKRLRKEGIQTYAFIAPILPMDPRRLVDALAQAVDCILIDRLNYSGRIRHLYEKHGLARYLDEIYFEETAMKIEDLANRHDIRVEAGF